jgi:hypothetical protein
MNPGVKHETVYFCDQCTTFREYNVSGKIFCWNNPEEDDCQELKQGMAPGFVQIQYKGLQHTDPWNKRAGRTDT